MNTQLPINIEDAIGKRIILKTTVSKNSIKIFGTSPYIFDISKNPVLLESYPKDRIIRLFPEEEYPSGRVHALGCIMSYEGIRNLFELAST